MEKSTPREPSGIIAEDVLERLGPLALNCMRERFPGNRLGGKVALL